MSKSVILIPASVAEHIADREGLTGTARQVFLQFVRESLGLAREADPNRWRHLLVASCGAGAAGLVIESLHQPSGWFLLIWPLCAVAGTLLALRLHRADVAQSRMNPEIHWRVYCLLLRPVILEQKPGLLDRNHPADRSADERLSVDAITSIRSMVADRGPDLWWSSLIGLWIGMSLLVAANLSHLGSNVPRVLLPLVCALVTPCIWGVWRSIVYHWLKRD